MRAAFIAFTRRGCALACKLAEGLSACADADRWECSVHGPARFAQDLAITPYESLDSWTAEHFAQDAALVFVGATGIAVRAIAPHVKDKYHDPAVVSIDEAGAFAVSLLSGHVGGANALARTLARLNGGQAVVSTATDVNGVFAVDEWAKREGLSVVERDVAKQVSAALLEGDAVGFACDAASGFDGDIPKGFTDEAADLGVLVSADTALMPFRQTLHLVPRTITVGVGCRKGVEPARFAQAVDEALAAADVSRYEVAGLATIEAKRGEPAIEQLAAERGWAQRYYSADALARVPGNFAASAFVEQTVGVGNVCERAACAEGRHLILGKQVFDGITVALGSSKAHPAIRPDAGAYAHPVGAALSQECAAIAPSTGGSLFIVGLGPGGGNDLSGHARAAIEASDLIVGYTVYVNLLRPDYPEKEYYVTPMRKEVERCRYALEQAAAGRTVAVVCSGDPGVYGMAGLVIELAEDFPSVDIEVVPGITASNGGAAVLGAPLMHDHCLISLSDLLTPWETIERRLEAAARADFVICLYNPSSHTRVDYLQRACDILLAHRSPETVCGIVSNIGRSGQESRTLPLDELRDTPVNMFTTVFIGNSQTREIGGRMVTPRGYLRQEA